MRGASVVILLAAALGGCAPEFLGTWDVTWTVGSAAGFCADEVGEVSTSTLTVSAGEKSSEVVVEGMGDADEQLDGSFEGKVLTFGGVVTDGGGTTTTSTELTIADDGDSMSGTETWSWESEANPGACPEAESSVEAVRKDE